MDGFELHLPRTKDILRYGYVGRWLSNFRQQYYPTIYTVFCLDVLSEVIFDIRYSHLAGELSLAEAMVASLPGGSICIYDDYIHRLE